MELAYERNYSEMPDPVCLDRSEAFITRSPGSAQDVK